jgi:GTP-binding protein
LKELPTVVIIGRPNVGKSRFFNRLTKHPAAIVDAAPGMTLDYLTETIPIAPNHHVRLIDTGGVQGEEDDWTAAAVRQTEAAVGKADALLVMVDARSGLQYGDKALLNWLRRQWPRLPRLLLVNKAEGLLEAEACADFYSLQEDILPVSALRGSGVSALKKKLEVMLPATNIENEDSLTLAIVGRPNAGKSTLLNRLLKEERAVVSSVPGTTRDSIMASFRSRHGLFSLIDTAGMRRQRARTVRERLSVAAARYALQQAKVALLVADMAAGASYQDKRIASLIAESGCATVVIGNKSDLLPRSERPAALRRLSAALPLGFSAPAFAISALNGRLPVEAMLAAASTAIACSSKQFSTALLTRTLIEIVKHNPPPISGGFRPKLRYAHQGGKDPLQIVIHGGGVKRVADDYRRYLASAFASRLEIIGTPLRIELRSEDNPYA